MPTRLLNPTRFPWYDHTRYSFSLGVAAGDHAVIIWPLLCGMAKAKYYLLTSDFLDGKEADRIGLVSKTVPDDELIACARGIAERLRDSAPLTLQSVKQNLNDSEDISFAEALNREARRHVVSGTTEDAGEAGRAFMEKRAPNFQGR